MEYLEELATRWRPLLAATLGISAGIGMSVYAQSIMAPLLLEAFGWSRASFALIGIAGLLGILFIPAAGRLADLFGTRLTILPGVLLYPLGWALFSLMDGSLTMFILISIFNLIVGAFTSSAIYSRLIAVHFERARGMALAMMISGPAVAGAIGAPLLTRFTTTHGWREGYLAIAGFSLVLGLIAFALMPPTSSDKVLRRENHRTWNDYKQVFTAKAFWIIFGGLALCNIPNVLHATQMSLMLIDRGVSAGEAGSIISIYATGVIIGRLVCGAALDRFAPEPVAVIGMGLPAIGMILLAFGSPTFLVVGFAMLLVGLSQGAESDIGAFLTIKYFNVQIYGTVFSLVLTNAVMTTALGTVILSYTLKVTDSFTAFLTLSAFCILIGSLLLSLLGRAARPAQI